jgi:hypothetical protein
MVRKPSAKQLKLYEEAVENGNILREKIRGKIFGAIDGRETSLTNDEVIERSRKIESSIFNWAIRSINESNAIIPTMKTMPKTHVLARTSIKEKKKKYDDDLERKLIWKQKWIPMPNSKLTPNWECNYFRWRYINKSMGMLFNLRDKRNEGFIQAIVDKLMPLREIANLNPDEIFPELWKPIQEKVWEKEVILGFKPDDFSDGIEQCRKCKSFKTTYYSKQTRSADEPMTNFFTCHNCGKHWKT